MAISVVLAVVLYTADGRVIALLVLIVAVATTVLVPVAIVQAP